MAVSASCVSDESNRLLARSALLRLFVYEGVETSRKNSNVANNADVFG